MAGDLVVLAAKGNTLRTALRKKADIVPSPAGISVNDAVSRAIKTVLASLEDSKAENIVSIYIQGKSSLGDYMVVASGRSHRHVGSIADRVLDDLRKAGCRHLKIEGMPNCDWVLIDAGDVPLRVVASPGLEPEGLAFVVGEGQFAVTGDLDGRRGERSVFGPVDEAAWRDSVERLRRAAPDAHWLGGHPDIDLPA